MNKEDPETQQQPQQILENVQLPYVTGSSGNRQLQSHQFQVAAGSVPQGTIQQFNQTAQWALIEPGDYSRKTYELLGGGTIFNEDHIAVVHPENQTKAAIEQMAPDDQNVNQIQVIGIVGMITAIGGWAAFRSGLHKFPQAVTDVSPGGQEFTRMAHNAVDVTMTSNRQGSAIMTGLKKASEFIKKISVTLRFDRVINWMTFATSLHNAAMLSKNIGYSLTMIVDNALRIPGWQPQDENGNTVSVGQILSQTTTAMMKTILGEEVWEGTLETWHQLNRVIMVARNVRNSVISIYYSISNLLTYMADSNNEVANALIEHGVLPEDAYDPRPKETKFYEQIEMKLNNAYYHLNSLNAILADINTVKDEVGRLNDYRKEFIKEVDGLNKAAKETYDKVIQENERLEIINETDDLENG
ncbi:hypothetical protein L3556_06385 [Candidatus Synechococcus calcipolaris G9]|uniref:Uncharacterized protein n=1 Tax=Candidatus Synechococcus calcipolaris G9 TaxID=1497997 RepID=A0ABT6EYC4_9SYNE|nr:hypothetical protein [Candidatus Synechococcus calcipolaris G9]